MLNLFYQGRLESIEPNRPFFDGIVTVIRPMILLKEKDIVGFARQTGYPIGQVDCPNTDNTRRARVAAVLRDLQRDNRHVKTNIWRAAQRAATRRTQPGASPSAEPCD